jgi:chitin-binding protein
VGPAASGSGGASVLVDNTPPSTPSLSGSVKRKTQVNLTWTEASDTGSGVARYGVHREDAEGVATEWLTLQTRFSDSWTVSGATYTYTVYALDAAGLRSADSNELVISLGGKKGGGGKGKKK